jgi:hypothetical protein
VRCFSALGGLRTVSREEACRVKKIFGFENEAAALGGEEASHKCAARAGVSPAGSALRACTERCDVHSAGGLSF